MNRQRAIVLKNHSPKRNILSLFDRDAGRIDGINYAVSTIPLGALIEYVPHEHQQGVQKKITDIQLYDLPLALAAQDIIFLHQVLELCHGLIPLGSHDQDVFNLLQILYTPGSWIAESIYKKIFLSKLLVMLGLYPENVILNHAWFLQMVQTPFDEIVNRDVSRENEEKLDQWLQTCIASYPEASAFKTIHFLKKCREL